MTSKGVSTSDLELYPSKECYDFLKQKDMEDICRSIN